MKKLTFSILVLSTFAIQSCTTQIKNSKTETVKVFGNCEMCKKNIETAANKKEIASVVWDKDNKTAVLTYDSTKTNSDEILKRIALAGYDNQKYLAPDDAYNQLDMCCQYERKKPANSNDLNNHSHHKDSINNKNPEELTAETPLIDVYTAYFALKDALTKDDGQTSSLKAKELFNAIDKVNMAKMETNEHTVWMKYMKEISNNAESLKNTTNKESQREYFAKLSAAMIEVMKTIKPDYTVYIDHCPMYKGGKGADWLSKEKGIKNPYFGNSMLTCGSTTQTISK